MFKISIQALRATLVVAVLSGIIFPLMVTVVAQVCFPFQANGSLSKNREGQIIGSELIGQQFSQAKYFHPRPSAAGAGYAAEASGASNLGPASSKLFEGIEDNPQTKADETFLGVKQLANTFRHENNLKDDEQVPVDAVTRSGSGLDPHISVKNASMQAARVASARSCSIGEVIELIDKSTEPRQFGILGEPRVNVLAINKKLDDASKVAFRR